MWFRRQGKYIGRKGHESRGRVFTVGAEGRKGEAWMVLRKEDQGSLAKIITMRDRILHMLFLPIRVRQHETLTSCGVKNPPRQVELPSLDISPYVFSSHCSERGLGP